MRMTKNIKKAVLLIGVDNGIINRTCTENNWLGRVEKAVIKTASPSTLDKVENFLGSLTESEFETVCCGEVDEADAILDTSPDAIIIDDFLDRIFGS